MSKRHISQQQKRRMMDRHARIRQSYDELDLQEGLVITCFGKKVLIEQRNGTQVIASQRQGMDGLVAGDVVLWQADSANAYIVVNRLPRKTELKRMSKTHESKIIAANIDRVVIVVASKPEISWPLLDSYLVMCEHLDLSPIIVLNKSDLPCLDLKKTLTTLYEPLGYPVIALSKNDGETIVPLLYALKDHVSVFVGQSGVGKSTLIQTLIPDLKDIKIQAISEQSELGRHTTSNAKWYHLPQGGAVIDSPGVREFSLWQLDAEALAWGYKEFRPFLGTCKFRNCTHENTPGCAIQMAIESGRISPFRYSHFLTVKKQFCA